MSQSLDVGWGGHQTRQRNNINNDGAGGGDSWYGAFRDCRTVDHLL